MAATRRPPAKRQQQRKPATRNAPAKRAAPSKHSRARAAGSAGHPAPPYVDDSASLEAYSSGREQWLAAGNSEDTYTDPSATPAQPEGPSQLEETDAGGGRSFLKQYGPYQPGGAQGDAAGLILGALSTAFLINVLNGTWQAWLYAKFLNKVKVTTVLPGGGGAPETKNPDGSITTPQITNNPDGSQTIPGGST
jgi:hypothetical protein